jgi:signal peptidase II
MFDMKKKSMNRWLLFSIISAVGLAADVITKQVAAKSLVPGLPLSVIGDKLEFMLLFNKNAIFGIDPRAWIPWFPLNMFFYIFSAIAITFLMFYFSKMGSAGWPSIVGISFIMPGALGNLWDRVFYPGRGVVDFIKMGVSRELYWPVFNFADIYISVGVGLIILDMVREEFLKRKPRPSNSE